MSVHDLYTLKRVASTVFYMRNPSHLKFGLFLCWHSLNLSHAANLIYCHQFHGGLKVEGAWVCVWIFLLEKRVRDKWKLRWGKGSSVDWFPWCRDRSFGCNSRFIFLFLYGYPEYMHMRILFWTGAKRAKQPQECKPMLFMPKSNGSESAWTIFTY